MPHIPHCGASNIFTVQNVTCPFIKYGAHIHVVLGIRGIRPLKKRLSANSIHFPLTDDRQSALHGNRRWMHLLCNHFI